MQELRLPRVHGNAPTAQAEPSPTVRFAEKWMAALGDKAAGMRADGRLMRAAADHAEYLASRTPEQMQLSPHIGSGHTFANERVLAQNYKLPAHWPALANSVESIIGPVDDPVQALAGLLASPPHRAHLLRQDWFSGHTAYGVGYAEGQWTIVSCPPEANL